MSGTNTGRIDDIINVAATQKQINDLNAGLDTVITRLVKVAEMVEKTGVNINGAKGLKELTDATEKLNSHAREATKLAEQEQRIISQLIAMKSDQAKRVAELNVQKKIEAERTRLQVQTNAQLVGAYKALLATQQLAKNELKDLAAAGDTTSKRYKELAAQIGTTDAKINQIDKSVGEHQKNVGNYGSALNGIKGAWVAVTAAWTAGIAAGAKVISFFKEGIQKAIEQEHMNNLLKDSVNGNVAAFKRLQSFRERMYRTTTFSKEEINSNIAQEMVMGRTESQTKKMIETAMGLSKVLGTDVHAAMMQLNQTLEGSAGRLGRISGQVRGLSEEQLRNGEAIEILNAKFGRFATEGMDGLEGRLNRVEKLWGKLKRTMGEGVTPMIDTVLTAAAGGEEGKLQKAVADRKNQLEKAKQTLAGYQAKGNEREIQTWQAQVNVNSELLGQLESELRLLQARNKLLEETETLKGTKAGLKKAPEQEINVWVDKSMTPEALAVKRAKIFKEIEAQILKDQEEAARKAAELAQKAEDERAKQAEGAAKLRLTLSNKSINELWALQVEQIKKENGFKLLNEEEQSTLLLDRRKKFLDEQFKQTEDIIKDMQAMLKDLTGGTGAITIPVIVAGMTATGSAPAKMDKIDQGTIDNTSEPKTAAELALEADKKAWMERLEMTRDFVAQIKNLTDSIYANEFQRIDEASAANATAKEKELAAAGDDKRKKEEIEKRYRQKEIVLEKERKKAAHDKAVYDKILGAAQIVISTAVGAMAQGTIAGAIAYIALGAVELLALLAAQIPSYEKGRKGGKAEFAKVHPGEIIKYPSGKMAFTPDVPETLAFLPAGADVISHDELIKAAGGVAISRNELMKASLRLSIPQATRRKDVTSNVFPAAADNPYVKDILTEIKKPKTETRVFDEGDYTVHETGNHSWRHRK